MRIVTAMLAGGGAVLLLSGCGSQSSGDVTTADGKDAHYTIDKATGETSMTIKGDDGDATMRSGPAVPVDLPKGFSLFPGSKVITNTLVNQPDGEATMLTFEAGAPADKVVAHYKGEAKAAGFDIQIEMDTNGTRMIGGERKGDGATLSVTASAGEGGAVTTGQIIIATKKGG